MEERLQSSDPLNSSVIGGRVGDIGVRGLTLGGVCRISQDVAIWLVGVFLNFSFEDPASYQRDLLDLLVQKFAFKKNGGNAYGSDLAYGPLICFLHSFLLPLNVH